LKKLRDYIFFVIYFIVIYATTYFYDIEKYDFSISQLYFGAVLVLVALSALLLYRCYVVLKTFDYFYFFISYFILLIIMFTIIPRKQTFVGFKNFYDYIVKYTEIIFWTWGMFIVREKSESKKFMLAFFGMLTLTFFSVIMIPEESLDKIITLLIYLQLLYMCLITTFKLRKEFLNILGFKIAAEVFMMLNSYTDKSVYLVISYTLYIYSFMKMIYYLNINLNRGHFRKLLEKERKIKKIIDISNDGIIILEDYLINRVNRKAIKILGIKKGEDVVAKNIFSTIDGLRKKDLNKALKAYPEAVTVLSKKYGEIEKKYKIVCTKFKGFESENIVIAIKDMHEIKQELMYKFNDQVKALIFIYQENYGYKYISNGIQDILGYTPKELYNKPELAQKFSLSENDNDYLEIFKLKKEVVDREIKLKDINGKVVSILANSGKVEYEDKEFYYFVGVDVSRYKEKEISLLEKNEELEAINLKKEMGMSIVSHEIRTPITAIIGFVENILINKHKVSDNILNMVQKIYSNGIRLKELINNLLDYNKINAGKMDLYPEKIDTKELISEVMLNNEMLMEIKNISVKQNLKNNISAYVDSGMLYQIVNNIVSNAIKYTEKNGKIEVCNRIEGDDAVIEIKDNGIGISESNKDRVFQAYERAKGMKEKGTGLGLALTKRLVEVNNGEIKFESQLGHGTTFFVYFPMNR